MKVYVKKGECDSPIPAIIVTLVFLSFSVGIFTYAYFSCNSILEALVQGGVTILFAIVFFAFALLFICYLFKKPAKFNAKLTKKVIQNYKGKQITYMTFIVIDENGKKEMSIPYAKYKCFSYGKNDLVENKKYIIKVKEFNWKIKAVEEILDDFDINVLKIPKTSIDLILTIIGFISGGFGVISVLRTIPLFRICRNIYWLFNNFMHHYICYY